MKKKFFAFTGVLLILTGVICAGMGIKSYLEEKNAGKDYEKLKTEVMVTVTPEAKQQEPVEEEKSVLELPVDLEAMMEKYPDVYAWIQIPGTGIDYPIVQRTGDNSYYLNHTVEGKKKIEGAIFTEAYNAKDFSDANTVIYGHNMKNGSMFQQLHRYEDRKFLKENPDVVIYQTDQILHYRIFAAYVYDNRHLMESFDFSDPDVYAAYIDSIMDMKNMSNAIDDSVSVTSEDKMITLSTCNGNDKERYLVQAVLLSIEK